MRLVKALFGARQASRRFWEHLHKVLSTSLSHVATNYASRHDSIEHQWITVAGFLTGRVGNYKDRVTYNRHVLDV